MKRSTLLLAATLLGTACSSHSSSPGDLTFFWAFQDAANQRSGDFGDKNGCGVAGVDTVEITIDQQTSSHDCAGPNAAGVILQTFVPGSYPYSITGLRSNEVVFTGGGTAVVTSGQNNQVDALLSAVTPQSFDIFYNPTVSTTGTTPTVCVFNGSVVSGIVFRIEDLFGNVVASTEIVSGGVVVGQQLVACDPNSFGVAIPGLALGAYRLRYLQAVAGQTFPFTSVAEACALSVSHTGFPIVVPLAAPTGAPCL